MGHGLARCLRAPLALGVALLLSSNATLWAVGSQAGLAALLERYRSGESAEAVAAVLRMDPLRVERESKRLELDPDGVLALGLLHSEALLRATPGRQYEVHAQAVGRLMFRTVWPLVRETGDLAAADCLRRWYAPVLLHQGRRLLDESRDFLVDDPRVQLARGIWSEYWMGPVAMSGARTDYEFPSEKPYVTSAQGTYGARAAASSLQSFRRALELDPTLAEARLRLGRVLFLLGRIDEAEAALVQVGREADGADKSAVAYLSGLFLGRLYEHAGRPEMALEAYGRARRQNPAWLTAATAESRLLMARGDMGAAADRLRMATSALPEGERMTTDPWLLYPRGLEYWYRYDILASLRSCARR
jgi:tetratricopeptide (TPR) repeat protein